MTAYRLTDAARKLLRQMADDGQLEHDGRRCLAPDGLAVDLPDSWFETAMPVEPEPGAYRIGGKLAVRLPRDDTPNHWAIEDPDGMGWFVYCTWPEAVSECGGPGVEIVPLVPAVPATTAADPGECPIPFPGEKVAKPLPGGGWVEARRATGVAVPEYEAASCGVQGPDRWYCSGHIGRWHIAGTARHGVTGGRVGAVWPIR